MEINEKGENLANPRIQVYKSRIWHGRLNKL